MMKNKTLYSILLLLILAPTAHSQSVNNNPWVKVERGRLWVLSPDNITYAPYFIKAVGYSPIPIGRYPSDWGYSHSAAYLDPHNYPGITNNLFDDAAVLNRDFALLQQMNANTVRIWKGNNTLVTCQCTNNGRFPNYITQNTLGTADHYGLKVIAGFWVNALTFDAQNNIGSTDDTGNPLTSQQIIQNFVNYVNALKNSRAVLFWAIGNENNYQRLRPSLVTLTAFENQISGGHGADIYQWLQQNNYLDFNGGVLIDPASGAFQSALSGKLAAIQDTADFNTIINILTTARGSALNPQQLKAWYALVNAMAKAAHLAEDPSGGKNYHPVAVVNGEIAEIGNSSDGAADSQMPDLDIWGANIYRGHSFGLGANSLFFQYMAKSKKPLWISEFGIDAFATSNIPANIAGINDWTVTNPNVLNLQGQEDQPDQSVWDGDLWDELANNDNVTIGGSVMEYSDEWWKPYEFYCGPDSVYCNTTQNHFAFPQPAFPDNYENPEWFGINAISPNPNPGTPGSWGPDKMTPRTVYYNLQKKWVPLQGPTTPLLSVRSVGKNNLLIWTASSPHSNLAIAYEVYRAVQTAGGAMGPFQFLAGTPMPAWTDTTAQAGNIYQYYVVAYFVSLPTKPASAPSNIVTVTNVTPLVILTSNSFSYTAPASVYLSAFIREAGAAITKVEFYNGTTLIGTATQSTPAGPYSDFVFVWNIPTPGSYSITAKAYDSNNNATVSAPADFTVHGPPVIAFRIIASSLSPTLILTATASEAFGSIKQVAFYNDSTLLATVTTAPYTFTWTNVKPGTHQLTAAAFDYSNQVAVSSSSVFVQAPPMPPASASSQSKFRRNIHMRKLSR